MKYISRILLAIVFVGLMATLVTQSVLAHANHTLVGTAFIDLNGDGAQGLGEAGLSRKMVIAQNLNISTISAITSTDTQGNFIFNGLEHGKYRVTVRAGEGYFPQTSSKVVTINDNISTQLMEFGFSPVMIDGGLR